MHVSPEDVTGVVLAGGRGRRLQGADKGLALWRGRPIIEYVLNALRPQVRHVVINANRNKSRYAAFGYPVINDDLPDFQGPLAGIACAMDSVDTDYLAVVPCDCPSLATDLVCRLCDTLRRQDGLICVAHDGKRLQPLFALFDRKARDSLRDYLRRGGRKPDQWYSRQGFHPVDFSDRPTTFSNLNTKSDFAFQSGGKSEP